jgi:hypothetical protein
MTGGLSYTHGQGSIPWMAPELLVENATFKRTFETDIYAFAYVMVEVRTVDH